MSQNQLQVGDIVRCTVAHRLQSDIAVVISVSDSYLSGRYPIIYFTDKPSLNRHGKITYQIDCWDGTLSHDLDFITHFDPSDIDAIKAYLELQS